MDFLKRIVSIYLVLTALAVFFNLMLTPVYHDGSPDYPVWDYINYFMAAGVLLALLIAFLRKKAAADPYASDADTLWANIFFYASIALTMLFYWQYLWLRFPESETGDAVTSHIIYFPLVDALYTIVALDAARYLWRRD